MAEIDTMVRDFLEQDRIAVVGVSDRRDTGCNPAYRRFLEAGHEVYPVNPRLSTFEGRTCYPDLRSIPEVPDAVFVMTNPTITEDIVRQCAELGVKHVWMHCMMGTKPGLAEDITSVSQEAVRLCHQHGITVIPGACPNQFIDPDFGHTMMRVMWRALGFMRLPQRAPEGVSP